MQLPNRIALLTLLPPRADLVGAELGVAAAAFSVALLATTDAAGRPILHRLHSIDRWTDHHDATEERHARALLASFGARSVVHRATFAEAAPAFAPGSLDFIYIDGYAHTGQEGGATLRQWWPMLRPGGLFAGHDYDPAWPATIAAVDAFARELGRQVHVTAPGGDRYVSWYLPPLIASPNRGGTCGKL